MLFRSGNPVRASLTECGITQAEARKHYGLNPDMKTILVIGGSLGARTINRSIAEGLAVIKNADVQVIWQTGKLYDAEARERLANSGAKNVIQMPFITDMEVAYRAADLVVSRAGASSISELQLLGKASILVPSPNVAEDHQTKNAMALVNRDAALLVRDDESQAKLVDEMLWVLSDNDKLKQLSENVEKMALRDSDKVIVDNVERIIEKNRK